jgi:4-hydroxythreonine-4-phosphate dehydrogenase
MGDPAGVGPELCLKLLADPANYQRCIPLLFGDAEVLRRVASILGLAMPATITPLEHVAWHNASEPMVVDLAAVGAASIEPGVVDATTGAASYRYVTAAIDAAMSGHVDAVCTGPINKEALQAAGIPFPGHTELLADRTKADRVCMLLTSNEISCCFVTGHVGYADVLDLLNQQRITDTIELAAQAMMRLRGRAPRIVVCGLNPHSGERGLFGGGEEERIIAPAVARAKKNGLDVEGPLPPDTAFLPWRRAQTDVYVCMYHDQGSIPLKALAFDVAVNVTLGLPIVRTSVDHGTACDIAWQGTAKVSSLREAVQLAAALSQDTVVQPH